MTDGGATHLGPVLVVLGPLVAALVRWPLGRLANRWRQAFMIATPSLTLAGLIAMAPQVIEQGRLTASVPVLLGQLRFSLDGIGLLIALVASFVWICSTLAAGDTMSRDPARKVLRYDVVSLVALAGVLGVVTAADLVTLYVSFEWLGLIAYLFVIHSGTRAAEAAGLKYGVMTLLGGFSVLTGVLLVHFLGGGDLGVPVPSPPGSEGIRAAAALCLLLGFGVKAGVIGLHVWLPDAHTAAPAPASALLSGIMIKAGAFGIARTLGGLYRPEVEGSLAALRQAEQLGLAVLWLGIATMVVGVVAALLQHQAKRVLAYSSVSQMGFILVGLGAAAYLGEGGVSGWTGALLHVTNHALFKALLFVAIGAVIARAGIGDLRRLGGLARSMPWTLTFVLVAMAGIIGVPLFNGFVSKSIIHHALEYAVAGGATGLGVAERIFTLTTVGTAAVLIKLVSMTFFGPRRGEPGRAVSEAPASTLVAMAGLSLAVVAIGLRPVVLEPLLSGGLATWGLPAAGVGRWLAAPIADVGDVRAALLAIALGAVVHGAARRLGLYERDPPAWLSIDRAYLALALGAVTGGQRLAAALGRWPDLQRDALAGGLRALERFTDADTARRRRADAASAREPTRDRRRLEGLRGRLTHGRLVVRDAAGWVSHHLDDSPRIAAAHADDTAPSDRERFVGATRERIQRQSRDIGLSLMVLVVVWLGLLVSLAVPLLRGG